MTNTEGFRNINEIRSDVDLYVRGLKAMIYMEEFATSKQIRKFNIEATFIKFHTDDIFQTRNSVRIKLALSLTPNVWSLFLHFIFTE